MSRAPLVALKPERAFPRGGMELVDTTIGWRFVNPRMAELHSHRVAWARRPRTWPSATACRARTRTRSRSSPTAARSADAEAGRFDDEIVTVDVPQPKGAPVTVHADEGPRRDTTLERLAALRAGVPRGRHASRPATRRRSTTAPPAWCVASDEWVERSSARAARAHRRRRAPPAWTPPTWESGPCRPSRKALERAGLTIDDIDLVELNEAFAAQALACVRELGIPHEKLNVNGGAIAIGHPLGASGARLIGTLAWELRRRGGRYGWRPCASAWGRGWR